MGPQCVAPGSALRGVVAGRIAIARRGTGAEQYNKPPNRTRGAGWAARVGADPELRPLNVRHHQAAGVADPHRALLLAAHTGRPPQGWRNRISRKNSPGYTAGPSDNTYIAPHQMGLTGSPFQAGERNKLRFQGKKKRNLKRLRLRFHQRRRFWRSAPPPVRRRHN